jgi:hypothetical protein
LALLLPVVSMFQWLFDQYLVAPLPYRLRSAKKGDATTPKGRTLRLDLSGGFDSATLARRVKTPHAAALFGDDDGPKKVGAEGRLRRRRSSLARVIQGASKALPSADINRASRDDSDHTYFLGATRTQPRR